jgi:hypothetical protein
MMYLATKAHRLRERARKRLFAGNAREAWELAVAAESAAPTLAGKRLERLARWLSEEDRGKSENENPSIEREEWYPAAPEGL